MSQKRSQIPLPSADIPLHERLPAPPRDDAARHLAQKLAILARVPFVITSKKVRARLDALVYRTHQGQDSRWYATVIYGRGYHITEGCEDEAAAGVAGLELARFLAEG